MTIDLLEEKRRKIVRTIRRVEQDILAAKSKKKLAKEVEKQKSEMNVDNQTPEVDVEKERPETEEAKCKPEQGPSDEKESNKEEAQEAAVVHDPVGDSVEAEAKAEVNDEPEIEKPDAGLTVEAAPDAAPKIDQVNEAK